MKKSLGFRNSSHKRQGIALVTVLIMLVMMVTLVSVTSLLALSNRRSIADTISTAQAQYAAEAGVEMALKRVYWDSYTNWKASADALVYNTSTADPTDYVDFDTCAYKKWLTGIGFGASDTDLEANNAASCPYVNFSTPATGAPFPGLKNNSTVNLSSTAAGAVALQQGVYDISIERKDSPTGDINLSMRSVGKVKDTAGNTVAQRVLSRTLKIAGDPYEGDRFAMLTTAANCSFCHLQIDTRQRALSTAGTFDRARIGFTSTETQLDFAEKAGADVVVYGGMYIRADLSKVSTHNWTAGKFARYSQQKDGKTKAGKNSDLVAASADTTLNASGDFAFNGTTGSSFYTNNVWDARKLVGATVTATTDPKGGANRANGVFYHNYPTKAQVDDPTGVYKGKWPDGALPDEFPAAIPDGGDGQVSDTDWNAFVGSAPTGRVEGTNVAASGATTPVFYGVRRPTSTNVNAAIPWVYDPIAANGIVDVGAPATITPANLQANPANFRKWWITQALASPNNRDFLPTTPGNPLSTNAIPNQLPFNTSAQNNAYQNNFYVNYNPTATGTLTLAYCSGQPYNAVFTAAAAVGGVRSDLQQCARGQYTGTLQNFVAAGNGNTLRSVTIPNVGGNVWFPQTSNTAMNDLMSGTYSGRAGYFDGNLIIDAGTLSGGRRPIQLTGTIIVNGDLVIRGKVLGNGRIVARGNIYVVGDLVYSCDTVGTACTKAQYAAGTNLPKLALLAGGNIIVGDYDAPDSRMNNLNRAFDLTNDQTGRNQVPNANVAWDYWNVPGSTGRPARGGSNDQYATIVANALSNVNPNGATVNFNGHAGFLTRSLEEPNSRASNKQVFKVSPFGYILGPAGSSELYENGGNNFVNGAGVATAATLSKNVSSLYPTNGPFKLGDRLGAGTTNGLVAATGYPAALGCGNSVQMPTRRYMFSPALAVGSGSSALPNANLPTAPLNFSFWCAPAGLTGTSFIRRNGTTTTAAAPNAQLNAWMSVNARDSAVDNNIGLTTGWLGGVLTDQAGAPVRGDLSQTRLLKLMWLSSMEGGRTQGPLRTDGILYSANAIANLLRSGQDARGIQSSTQSRWIHIGSVIASELGFLTTASSGGDTSGMDFSVNKNALMDFSAATGAPASTNGTWGTGFAILYDDRLQGFLQVTNTNRVKIRRTGIYAQVGVTR